MDSFILLFSKKDRDSAVISHLFDENIAGVKYML